MRASPTRRLLRRALPRPGSLRALAHLILALVVLFTQGTRLFELLLVRHAICEHGELLHLGASAAEGARPLAGDQHAGDEVRPAFASTSFGHDHCDAATCPHRLEALGPCLAPPRLLGLAPPFATGALPERRPIALLFVAPKGSPPRA